MAKTRRGGTKSAPSVIVTRLGNADKNKAINQAPQTMQGSTATANATMFTASNGGGQYTQPQQQAQPTVQDNTQATAPQAQPAQPAPTTQFPVYDTNAPYTDMTGTDQNNIYNLYKNMYNGNTKTAIKMYIADNTKNSSAVRSLSQDLNYALDNGLALNANLKYINDYLSKAMHPITKNTNLVKYGHSDIIDAVLKQVGLQGDYTKYTDSQLKKALVGVTYQQKSFSSYAYDAKSSPFAPNQPLGGGREVIFKLKANANTKIAFGNRKQTEVITDKNQNFKINDVYYDGSMAYPKNGNAKKRIVIEIETF